MIVANPDPACGAILEDIADTNIFGDVPAFRDDET